MAMRRTPVRARLEASLLALLMLVHSLDRLEAIGNTRAASSETIMVDFKM
jgi:hypothetical protein